MSAPRTDIEKQERRHAGPLIGMAACVAFAAIIAVAYFGFIAKPAEDGETVVEGTPSAIETE